jgi:probable addiction module antidote protein
MIKEKISRWNAWECLQDEQDVIAYLKVSLEQDSPDELIKSLDDILRSKGFTEMAKKMNVGRESLYKSFSGKSKPKFETIYKAIDSLGFRFDIVPKGA